MSCQSQRAAQLCLLVLLGCSTAAESVDTSQPCDDESSPEGTGATGQLGVMQAEQATAGRAGADTVAVGGSVSFRNDASSTGDQGGKPPVGASSEAAGAAGAITGVGGQGSDETEAEGGTSSSAASGAGNAGTGSVAGDTETKTCAEACDNDLDCRVDASDLGFICNPATQRCEKGGLPCHDSLECLPAASLWFLDCASDADCFYFVDAVCVSVAGSGKCARLAPGTSGDASGCEPPTADAVRLPQFGGVTSVWVCANTSQKCERGACAPACKSDAECGPSRNGSICQVATGSCRCVKDNDCGAPGVSRCNVATGICECSSAADCREVPGSDVCTGGRCGCSSAAVCDGERVFTGTTSICE